MASISDLRSERFEIAEEAERFLVNLLDDAVSQIDGALQDGNTSTAEALAIVAATFADIREDYFDSYEDIASPILEQLRQQGFLVDNIEDDVIDVLDDIQDDHLAAVDDMEQAWADRITTFATSVSIPGVGGEDLVSFLDRTRQEYSNEIIGNTDVFHRVMSDLFTGGMIVSAGNLLLGGGTSNWKYTYFGPSDNRNRPHCSVYVNKTLTRAEINAISPAQLVLAGNDPAVTPAYITTPCRHNWELASKE